MRSLSSPPSTVSLPQPANPVTACERVDRVVPGPGQDEVVRRRSGERVVALRSLDDVDVMRRCCAATTSASADTRG